MHIITGTFLHLASLEMSTLNVLVKIEPKLEDTQPSSRPRHSTTEKIFTLQQIWEILAVC